MIFYINIYLYFFCNIYLDLLLEFEYMILVLASINLCLQIYMVIRHSIKCEKNNKI